MDAQIMTVIKDLMSATVLIHKDSGGMLNLTEVMKQTLISGVMQIKSRVATIAFKYYMDNDFEVNDTTIPIFRDIVSTYAEAGGRL